MDDAILISNLNDFIFCPISIFFHSLYGSRDTITYQRSDQINGSACHERIDTGCYSTYKNVLSGIEVYSERYGLRGKIDIYDGNNKLLIERKRKIKTVYDGYVFQLYGQYFAMLEMGYEVKGLKLYSMVDNKNYYVDLPEKNADMKNKFENLIKKIREFNMDGFIQTNFEKCKQCIYEPACDRGMYD